MRRWLLLVVPAICLAATVSAHAQGLPPLPVITPPPAGGQVAPYGTNDFRGFNNVLPPGTNGFRVDSLDGVSSPGGAELITVGAREIAGQCCLRTLALGTTSG